MASESRSGSMAPSTRATGRIIKQKARVRSGTLRATSISVSSGLIKPMDMVCTLMSMVVATRASG